jgi:RNA polymerase sigma factor
LQKRDSLNVGTDAKNLTVIIDRIQKGDNGLREKFIKDYQPFILGCASKYMNKYVEIENSEEFSVALMAFNEAIEYYKGEKGRHFLSFAELVIKRRLSNFSKKERRIANTYPFSFFDSCKDNPLENVLAEKSVFIHNDRCEAREEIFIFNKKLQRFGITLDDLIKKTPKHRDSKQMLIKVASIIAENENLYEKLDRRMMIPMSELKPLININPKTVEKNRKYVIAACIAIKSDLDIIKGFLQAYLERG